MKLIELAKQYDLEPDLLREVVEQDLSIPLPKGMESELQDVQVQRILACDGLETSSGAAFKPIIAKEFVEKHQRAKAAKKGAETRKRKIQEDEEKKKVVEDAKLQVERKKHEDEIARRDAERTVREAADAEKARLQAESDEIMRQEIESARVNAENDVRKREDEAKRVAAQFAAMRHAESHPGEAAAAAEAGSSQPTNRAPAHVAPAISEPVVQPTAPTPVEAAAPTSIPTPVATTTAPAATAPVAPAAPVQSAQDKAMKGIGSKLASLAKATHEKGDHSIKHVPKPVVALGPARPSEPLTEDERRKLIQENIRKNLAMADKVKQAKIAERARRKPGFAPIDRSKTPGGPPGPNRGPGGRPGGPGRPGVARGPKRDSKDHRADKNETAEEAADRIARSRRQLSTDEQDLSGKTEFSIALPATVRELSEAMGIKSSTVIAKLFMAGMMANINSVLEKDAVELLAQEFKKTVTFVEAKTAVEEIEAEAEIVDKDEDLAPRPPVVTIMGHVDHGKTSLLDAIRSTEVAAGESGGITQHIGAYTVATPSGLDVTFIDTPGHQAFSEMRQRGAQVTDIVVLVVAADDGVMPQTIEAIKHAKAAGVPIVVAMNKIDKPDTDVEKVIRQLAEHGLQAEEWGGDIAVMKVSAHTKVGLPELLDRLALEADVADLKTNHFAPATGSVLEAHRHEGQGITATLLVRRGSLAIGDVVLAGIGYGRVRSMTDWKGEEIRVAGPSHAVEVIGLSELPRAGDRFQVLADLGKAAAAADERQQAQRERELTARAKVTTSASIFGDLAQAKKKEVKLVLKCDAAGSLEVLAKAIPAMSTDEVRANIIHSGVGGVTSNDITLAAASKAIVLGFHVIPDAKARAQGDQSGVDVRTYTIIYELLDDMKRVMSGLLEPEVVEKIIGHADVRQAINTTKAGAVAGLYVTDGRVQRDAYMRITREQVIHHTGKVGSLRRFKDDVREVKEGYECGLTIEGYQDIKAGDIMEFFLKEKKARSL